MVGCGHFSHGCQVVFGLLESHGAGIARDVIGPGKDDDDLGLKCDHILVKAEDHLRSGLAADAAIDVWLCRGKRVSVRRSASLR